MQEIQTLGFALVWVGLSACAVEHEVADGNQAAAVGKADTSEFAQQAPVEETAAYESPPAIGCDGAGTYDINVSGTDLHGLEGKRVWVLAFEPQDWDSNEGDHLITLEGTVRDGTFSLKCENSIDENYAYPRIAVVFDSNDDGTCNGGDLGRADYLYGWNSNIVWHFEGSDQGINVNRGGTPAPAGFGELWVGDAWSQPLLTHCGGGAQEAEANE